MATLSSLRSRRLAHRKTEPTEKLVVFPVHRDWFGLHLHHILRIEPFFNTTAITPEIQLIDLHQMLFPEVSSELTDQPSYLILLHGTAETSDLSGLVLHSKPGLQRFPQSQFANPSASEMDGSVFHKFCTMRVQNQNGFQVFLLDPAKIYLKG